MPARGRGRGRGRGRPPAHAPSEDSASQDTGLNERDQLVRDMREGAAPKRDLVMDTYQLLDRGQGKPRSLEKASLCIKNESDAQALLAKHIGADPSGKLSEEECTKVGLVNLGFTCYINAVLQMLASDDSFACALLALDSDDVPTVELQKIVAKLRKPNGRARWADPSLFISSLEVCASEQQDAHEFYRLVTEYLISANQGESPSQAAFQKSIKGLIEGGTMYHMKCLTCEKTTMRHEVMTELTVPLSGDRRTARLEDCIKEALGPAELVGDNQYECSHCRAKRDGQRQPVLSKLPEMLVVVVGRFGYDKKKATKVKRQTSVSYPRVLDVAEFTTLPTGDDETESLEPRQYSLKATIHHIGNTAFHGHYVARCYDDDMWHLYDDTEVSPDNKSNTTAARMTTNDVYVLLYTSLDRELVSLDTAITEENSRAKRLAEEELAREEADLSKQVAEYEQSKEDFISNASGVIDFVKEYNRCVRVKSDPFDKNNMENFCFVSNYWLHAFGHGKFIDESVASVSIRPVMPDAKKQEIVFLSSTKKSEPSPVCSQETVVAPAIHTPKGVASDGDVVMGNDPDVVVIGSSQTPKEDGGSSGSALVIYRDPFDLRNFDVVRCPHSTDSALKIDPDKIRGAKTIPMSMGQVLKETVGGVLPPTNAEHCLCEDCVRLHVTRGDDRIKEGKRRRDMIELGEAGSDGPGYWIGVKWWNEFKKKANMEDLLKTDLFEGARCPHGGAMLAISQHSRRLIPSAVYDYLVMEGHFHASDPALTGDAELCPVCVKQHSEETSNFNAIDTVKRQYKMMLKPLTDSVKQPDTASKIIGKDWVKERKMLHGQWEKKIAKMKKEAEAKRKKEAKERFAALRAEHERNVEQLGKRKTLSGGSIQCDVCHKRLAVCSWTNHKASGTHRGNAEANGICAEELECHHVKMELAEWIRREEVVDVDAEADDSTPQQRQGAKKRMRSKEEFSPPKPLRGKLAAGLSNATDEDMGEDDDAQEGPTPQEEDASDTAAGDVEMEEEEEEEGEEDEEEEEEDPYKEPDSYINNTYVMLDADWAGQLVAWYQSPTVAHSTIIKPEAMKVKESLYCVHGDLKYNYLHYMGARGERPPGFEREKLEAAFVLVPECLDALRKLDLLDESEGEVPVYSLSDGADKQIHHATDPRACGKGCCESELESIRDRKTNFTNGVITIQSARNVKKVKKVSPRDIHGISSEMTVFDLLWKIHEELDTDPRMIRLVYNDMDLTQAASSKLNFYGVENNSDMVITILDHPNLEVASLMDGGTEGLPSASPGVPAGPERGFASSRLQSVANATPAGGRGGGGGSYACPVCTFVNEGRSAPPCEMCGQ